MLLNAKLIYFKSASTITAGFAAFAKQTNAALHPSTQLSSTKKWINYLKMESNTNSTITFRFAVYDIHLTLQYDP